MNPQHFTGTRYDRGGSRAIEFAREDAPGPELNLRVKRFCVICGKDCDPTGGRVHGGELFTCALHVKTKREVVQ